MRGWLFLCSSWKGDNEFDIPHTLRNINMLSYTSSSCHSLSLQANTHTVVAKESLDYMPSVSYKDHKDHSSGTVERGRRQMDRGRTGWRMRRNGLVV